MSDSKRLRGLKDLVRDVVVNGASAIETVHRQTAKRPFYVLKRIPPIAAPAADIETIIDTAIGASYASVRGVTAAVAWAADKAIDVAEALADGQATKAPTADSAEPVDDSPAARHVSEKR